MATLGAISGVAANHGAWDGDVGCAISMLFVFVCAVQELMLSWWFWWWNRNRNRGKGMGIILCWLCSVCTEVSAIIVYGGEVGESISTDESLATP